MNVLAPDLHPGQRRVQQSKARWRVLACGRRWGKSLLALLLALESALRGGRVLWLAPTFQVSELAWSNAKKLLGPIASRLTWRESSRTLHVNGVDGCIVFRSAEQGDSLRGDAFGGDEPRMLGVVVDEAAFVDPDLWATIVRPMLADRRASALLVSTPNGMNWFRDLFEHARGDTSGEWEAFQFPTSSNPHIAPDEVEAMRHGMPQLAVLQELEAQFVSTAGARVQRDWLRLELPPHCSAITLAFDLAISERSTADYTACVVMGRAADGRLWVLDAERVRASFNDVLEFIRRKAAQWKPTTIAIEQVSAFAGVVTELQRTTSLPIRGVRPQGSKLERFAPLEGRIQNGMVRFARDIAPWFIDEVCSFPVGAQDDGVDAFSLAFAASDSPRLFAEFDRDRHVIAADTIRYTYSLGLRVVGVDRDAMVTVARARDGTAIVLAESVHGDPHYIDEGMRAARDIRTTQRPERFVCDHNDEIATHALRDEFFHSLTTVVWASKRQHDVPTLVRNTKVALGGKGKKPALRISDACPRLIDALSSYGADPPPVAIALARALNAA